MVTRGAGRGLDVGLGMKKKCPAAAFDFRRGAGGAVKHPTLGLS